MKEKILITYASKYGSTKEIAQKIGAGLGLPMNALVISSTLFGKGIAGLGFGWLFWAFSSESAMLAHFLGDAIVYTLIPVVASSAGETARYITAAAAVILLPPLRCAFAPAIINQQSKIYNPKFSPTASRPEHTSRVASARTLPPERPSSTRSPYDRNTTTAGVNRTAVPGAAGWSCVKSTEREHG